METILQNSKLAEQEHKAGFHNTYQESCYECYREARIIQARKVVNKPERYENNLSNGWDNFINNLK